MLTMKEKAFYSLCDKVEKASPKIKERLKESGLDYLRVAEIGQNINQDILLDVIFYSSNPFKEIEDEEYKKTVNHCKNLLLQINLQ